MLTIRAFVVPYGEGMHQTQSSRQDVQAVFILVHFPVKTAKSLEIKQGSPIYNFEPSMLLKAKSSGSGAFSQGLGFEQQSLKIKRVIQIIVLMLQCS
eukprot:c21876_g5_i1 orf=353-643(+)